jgi:hypothetical protein
VLVAGVRARSAVLNIISAVAVVAAAPEVSVKRLKCVGLDPRDWGRSENRADVLAGLAGVVPSGSGGDIESDFEVAVEQLIDSGGGSRRSSLVNLVLQPGERLLSLALGVRSSGDGLPEVHGLLRDRIDTGVDPHPV